MNYFQSPRFLMRSHFPDPVKKVTLNTNDLDKTQHYWQGILKMKVVSKTDSELTLAYDVTSTQLGFKKIG